MSIVAQCPHCETRFNLQPEMNGKSMRCPNLECRQVFTVQAMEAVAPPAPIPELPPEPKAPPRSPVPLPPPPRTKSSKSAKPAVVEARVVEATIVEAAVVAPSKMKEVVWSEGTDVPPPPLPKKSKKPLKADTTDDVDDDFIVRRKKKSNRRPMILAGMGIMIVALIGFSVIYMLRVEGLKEAQLADKANEDYKKGDYGSSAKLYDKLAKDYPDSKKIAEYKFFADLSEMQTVVRSVTNRNDYAPAVTRLNAFIEAHKESPLAKPATGYGHDVLEAGKKLGEDIAGFAGDRVKAFQANRTKSDELPLADKAIANGRELLPVLDPFRGPDDPPLDKIRVALDQTEKDVKRERDRSAAIARARTQLEKPTDALIQSAEADLRTAGFLEDDEAQKLIAAAKGKLLDLVQFVEEPAAAQPPPPTAAASLLFTTPVGKMKPRESGVGDATTVFLCVARGILYAFNEDTGALIWATRVGPDVTDPPPVARVDLERGPTDLAVVTSNVGNAPAVAGYELRANKLVWYQPLPAAPAGPAVVVGNHAFVPLRDTTGSVYEFDLKTGLRIGYIRFGQSVAERGLVARPGTNLLYVAADARRVYAIDAGGRDDAGNRINPRCVQVIATGHLAGTLKVPPLFIGPEGTEPAERWMVLSQADGTTVTKLRVFSVGAISPPPADGSTVPETPAVPVVALPVPGWVWFPPVSDGERLAVASDTGQLRLFGVNQAGNLDKPLFPLPAPAQAPVADDKPLRGLVIPVGESEYWLLSGGYVQKARLALVPSRGQEVVLAGPRLNVGEPVHAAQINARKDTACFVVRSPNSSGCRAVAFDLRSGDVRWQRQLGLVPAKTSAEQFAAPIPQGDNFVLVDEDGGIVVVPAASGVQLGETLTAPDGWVIAPTPTNATGPTVVASTADGKLAFAVTPVAGSEGAKFVVRQVAGGKLVQQDEVNAPAALAGQPAVVGGILYIPTADGFVNRFTPGAGVANPASLTPGPSWRSDRPPANAVCSVTVVSESSFVTSDGGKKLSRWEWGNALGARWSPAGSWELQERVAGSGVALPPAEPGGLPRFMVADTSGSVQLFVADKPGPHLRRWRSPHPGRPSSALAVQPADAARVVVTHVIDGKWAVALNPDNEDVLWTAHTSDDANSAIMGAPQPAGENRWIVTDLAGRIVLIDGASGDALARLNAGLPGGVPATASGVAANTVLTQLSDGSAVVVELPKKEPPKKE